MNYRLKIQYDGTRYRGWQRQPTCQKDRQPTCRKSGQPTCREDRQVMTIQGRLEAVLTKYAGRELRIDGAGRTDAGVHALEQVANVHMPDQCEPEPEELRRYLNEYLPEDIRVLAVQRAGERFHSRLNVTGKRYCYHLLKWNRENVFLRRYAWKMTRPLDLERMRRASEYLLGEHDFKSFCTKASKKKSTVRRITDIRVTETEDEVMLTFEGNGFLYNMVRILTGTLVETGTGDREPEELPEILRREERRFAGETAPAKGLFLEKVFYE